MSDAQFDSEMLHRGLLAVDRASLAGSKLFDPEDVSDADRALLWSHLLWRDWAHARGGTSITGSGQLHVPPQLTNEGRRVLAALEQSDLLVGVSHPSTAAEAWDELLSVLGPLTSTAESANQARSELRRWGIADGPASIARALQHAHRAGFHWSAREQAFLPGHLNRERLFVEQIDQFAKTQTTTAKDVAPLLVKGRVDLLEDEVQSAFERILGENFHAIDHGGEECDLYTSHSTIDGERVPTAFMLKGRGTRSPELQIADCGENGDQIVRLLQAPAQLFVIQYVGPVSQNVTKDIKGKVRQRRSEGDEVSFCILDGCDTARILMAYGDLSPTIV